MQFRNKEPHRDRDFGGELHRYPKGPWLLRRSGAMACLLSLAEARGTIEAWREHYNHRPHSSLGALTPVEFAQLTTEKLIPPPAGENNQRLYL